LFYLKSYADEDAIISIFYFTVYNFIQSNALVGKILFNLMNLRNFNS